MDENHIRKMFFLAVVLTLIGYLIFCLGHVLLSAPFAIVALGLMGYSLWAMSKM